MRNFLAYLAFSTFMAVIFCATVHAQEDGPAAPELFPRDFGQACAGLAADREAAYVLLRQGDVWGAASALVASARRIPGDDPYWVSDELLDESAAIMHLTVYVLESLMNDTTRDAFVAEVLKPGLYPTDELALLRFRMGHTPTLEENDLMFGRLFELGEGANGVVRVFALALTTSAYYFSDKAYWPSEVTSRDTIFEEYAGLSIAWEVERVHLYHNIKGMPRPAFLLGQLVHELRENGGSFAAVIESDPCLALVRDNFRTFCNDDPDVQRTAVAPWCQQVLTAPTVGTRYGYLTFLSLVNWKKNREKHGPVIEAAVRELALREGNAPDVVRAMTLTFEWARRRDDAAEVVLWGEKLLTLDRIVDPIERTLHEEVQFAIEHYADYLSEHGDIDGARRVYGTLGAKFPNSVLSIMCETKLGTL